MTRLFTLLLFAQLLAGLFMAAQFYFLTLQDGVRDFQDKRLKSATNPSDTLSRTGENLRLKEGKLYNEVRKSHVQTSRRLYLTYQPPDGGWNNHRIALENAIILAKLLNRTLIVHPVASHDMAISLRKKRLAQWKNLEKRSGINWVYNHMSDRDLVPISRVLDLGRIRSIVEVFEVRTNHLTFRDEFSHLKWHYVCHSDALGFWVDSIPAGNESVTRGIAFVPNNSSRSVRACPVETVLLKHANKPVIRRILEELQNVQADVIYLSQDTSYKANVQFFHMKDALKAQQWILSSMWLSPHVYKRAFQILAILPKPFNAIHVRRTDHRVSSSEAPSYWLHNMARQNFLNVSTALYVATDERDKNWFTPFSKAGYQLYFSDEFFESSGRSYDMDIRGLYDQLVCVHAKLFVGSKSSSFSGFIYRSRKEVMIKDGLILSHMPIGWLGHRLKSS